MAEVKIKIEGSGGLENLNENLAQGAKSVNSLKKELREVTLQLQGLDAGSEEFVKLSEKAGELRDKIKDTSEAINANAGPAFERLTNQFGLVGSKLATLDFGGAAESMRGLASAVQGFSFRELTEGLKSFGSTILSVGQALVTNPIFLLGAALAAIAMNFEEVSRWMSSTSAETERLNKLTGDLNKAYEKQLSSVAENVVKVEALTDAVIDNTNSETERREALKTLQNLYPQYFKNLGDDINNTDALTAAKNKLIESIQREAKVNAAKQLLEEAYAKKFALQVQVQEAAARMGMEKVAEAAEAAKYNSETLFVSANQSISDWINGTEGVGVAYNELKDTVANIAELERIANESIVESAIKTRINVDIENKKKETDRKKAANEKHEKQKQEDEKNNKERLEKEKKYQDELNKAQEERLNREEEIAEAIFQASLSAQEKEIQAIRDAYFEKIELANQYGLDSTALIEAQKAAEAEINKKYADAEAAAKQKAADEEKARQDKANADQIKSAELRLKVANDVFNGLIQLNDAFTSKDSARARRSFQISKTLGMAQATMNTWAAANAILKDPTYVGPTRFFAVAAAITAGLANVAKIAKTQFQESSTPSGGGGGGGGSTPSMTQVGGGGGGSTPSFNPLNTSFLQNQQGQQPPLQAFVLSTQVNSTVEAQQRIREQTTL